jgi:imidazolonepropionase-like amidohydrolase
LPNAADLVGMAGEIGTLAPGAHADLLVLDGDPLEDIGLLADPKHATLPDGQRPVR